MSGNGPSLPRVDPQIRQWRLEFGRRLRSAASKAGLTQESVAERAGCDRQTVCRAMNGTYSTTLDRCWQLAVAVGVPLAELLPRDHADRAVARATGPVPADPERGTR